MHYKHAAMNKYDKQVSVQHAQYSVWKFHQRHNNKIETNTSWGWYKTGTHSGQSSSMTAESVLSLRRFVSPRESSASFLRFACVTAADRTAQLGFDEGWFGN